MYEPGSTAETVLHAVVRAHLEQFLAATACATDGAGVPRFIEREFRDFLGCGDLRRGFCRVRCDGCAFDDPALVRHILTHLGILGDSGPPPGPWPSRA